MMMPANYSAIAENEMTYVVGGGIADYLAPVMTASNWQTFNKNLIMVVGNAFMGKFLENTLETVFGFGYKFGDVFTNIGTVLTNAYNKGAAAWGTGSTGYKVLGGIQGVANAGLQIVGALASIYALGNGEVKLGDAKINV